MSLTQCYVKICTALKTKYEMFRGIIARQPKATVVILNLRRLHQLWNVNHRRWCFP